MSTTTLSQRLRDLRIGLFPDIETVNAVLDECIAQAEREAQAGELSDEVIKRILNANTYEDLNDSRQGGYVTSSDHDAYDMGMIAGLKYAPDKDYLKPSQATPVVTHLNMDPNASAETIEAVKDLVQKAYSYNPSQAIGEPVAWMAGCLHDYRMDIVTDAWKKDAPSDGNMSKTFTIPLYRSPISPEARDKAIEALESIGKDAREVFDHGTSLLTVKAGSGRIIAVSDRALSALRPEPGAKP